MAVGDSSKQRSKLLSLGSTDLPNQQRLITIGHPRLDTLASVKSLSHILEKIGGNMLWRRTQLSLIVLLVVMSAGRPACAQSDLHELNQRVVDLYQAGKYVEATSIAESALSLAEQRFGFDHPSLGASLNNLAQLYTKQARYAEAEPLFRRSLAIKERSGGVDNPSVAVAAGNLGSLLTLMGRLNEAGPLRERE